MNTIGRLFRLTTFGESHGDLIGGIIDGCPAGLLLDLEAIQLDLNRRRPGQSNITTSRVEKDQVIFHSGIFEGKTTGAPIGFSIQNTNVKSKDYSHLKDTFRPSHSDFTYTKKYGMRDYRGGGRSSARETANWVVAGAIAKQIVPHISFNAYVSSVGTLSVDKHYQDLDLSQTYNSIVRCPDKISAQKMQNIIEKVKAEGDTIGGVVSCVIHRADIGLGEPVFDKLHAALGKAMLSINAVKGVEFGSGFRASEMRGSQHNDVIKTDESTLTNYSGGIQGGISNGMDIYFRLGFKPVSTLMQNQKSIDKQSNEVIIQGKGRHDPCVVPRAVPIVEALSALVIADFYLLNKISKI
ncbi:MAG: chorismate synthase [Flavobacteriales bacterium]